MEIDQYPVFDIDTRRYYDTVTWLAEVMPGSMRTPFEYSFDGRELYASDNSAMGDIFNESIERASNLPAYEQRRRHIEKEEYRDMIKMMKGELPNTMIVVSDFPPELMEASEDVGGYNVARKQTMLRVLVKVGEDKIAMYSQSLDGSNRQALENIYFEMGFYPSEGELLAQRMNLELSDLEQEFIVDRLTGVYDRSLSVQYGGEWYAGIPGRKSGNTYDFVCQQTDLIDAYLQVTDGFVGGFRDYSLAAAMKDRYLGITNKPAYDYNETYLSPVELQSMAIAEMGNSGSRAQARGEKFSGCGATLDSSNNINLETQLEGAGYGNKTDKSSGTEKLVWKKGVCRVDNCPTRPGRTEVAQCSVCRGCQAHFDKGMDPSKVYKIVKTIQPRSVQLSWNDSPENIKQKALAWLN